MAAHQRSQATVFGTNRVDFPPTGQEVVVDEPDHVEAVGHDRESADSAEVPIAGSSSPPKHACDALFVPSLPYSN